MDQASQPRTGLATRRPAVAPEYGYPVARVPPAGCCRAHSRRPDSRHDDHHRTDEPLTANRIAAAALAALGAASAIPIPLAQLDFAGLINAFNIDSGDSPRALLVIAGVGGILTIAVLALAFAGACLALAGAPSARRSSSPPRSPVSSRRCRSGFPPGS